MKLSDCVKRITDEDLKVFLQDETIREMIRIGHDGEGNDLFEWNIYHDVHILEKVVKKMREDLKEILRKIDYVASMGTSGSPLATSLALETKKNLILVHDRWAITDVFRPVRPFTIDISNRRILLVDSILRTGLTTFNGITTVREKEGIPSVAVMAFLSDWVDVALLEKEVNVDFYFMFPWNSRMYELAKGQGFF